MRNNVVSRSGVEVQKLENLVAAVLATAGTPSKPGDAAGEVPEVKPTAMDDDKDVPRNPKQPLNSP